MLKQFKYKNLVWIDLEAPTGEEIRQLSETYQIHPLVQAELERPSERSKVDVYKDLIYLVLRFPRVTSNGSTNEGNGSNDAEEVDFVLGKNFIITTHYELINPLNDFASIFQNDFMLKKNHEHVHPGIIFYYMLKEIYAAIELRLTAISRQLKGVEEQVFSGQERAAVRVISDINRKLLDCQRTVRAHHEILASLQIAAADLYEPKFQYYLQAIAGDERLIWKTIQNTLETFDNLRTANESLLSIKTNETMKLLTVIAFIFLPLNLVAQMYGAKPISLLLMAIFTIITVTIARKQKWL